MYCKYTARGAGVTSVGQLGVQWSRSPRALLPHVRQPHDRSGQRPRLQPDHEVSYVQRPRLQPDHEVSSVQRPRLQPNHEVSPVQRPRLQPNHEVSPVQCLRHVT